MASIENRLAALRAFLESHTADQTVFVVEGGGEFYTEQDPFTYLREHGAYPPTDGVSSFTLIPWRILTH